MAGERKPRVLRLPPDLDEAVRRAAVKDMRPVSVLIERILRREMIRTGNLLDPARRGDETRDPK